MQSDLTAVTAARASGSAMDRTTSGEMKRYDLGHHT
jgi:hypothetical protein